MRRMFIDDWTTVVHRVAKNRKRPYKHGNKKA